MYCAPYWGEDIVRPVRRRAEPSGNDSALLSRTTPYPSRVLGFVGSPTRLADTRPCAWYVICVLGGIGMTVRAMGFVRIVRTLTGTRI